METCQFVAVRCICPCPQFHDRYKESPSSLWDFLKISLYFVDVLGDAYFVFFIAIHETYFIFMVIVFAISMSLLVAFFVFEIYFAIRNKEKMNILTQRLLPSQFDHPDDMEEEEGECGLGSCNNNFKYAMVVFEDIPQFLVQVRYISQNPIDYIVVLSLICSSYMT